MQGVGVLERVAELCAAAVEAVVGAVDSAASSLPESVGSLNALYLLHGQRHSRGWAWQRSRGRLEAVETTADDDATAAMSAAL